jgi:hypothetical protein
MENEKAKKQITNLKNRNNFLTNEISSLIKMQETNETAKRIQGNFEEIEINNALISDLENKIQNNN